MSAVLKNTNRYIRLYNKYYVNDFNINNVNRVQI